MPTYAKLFLSALIIAGLLPFFTPGEGGRPLVKFDAEEIMPDVSEMEGISELKKLQELTSTLQELSGQMPQADVIELEGNQRAAMQPANDVKNATNQDMQSFARGDTLIYKWKKNGQLQYSSEAPPAGVPYETVVVSSKVNVITGDKPAPQAEEKATTGSAKSPYSPEGLQELMGKAKDLQKLSEERNQQIDQFMPGQQ